MNHTKTAFVVLLSGILWGCTPKEEKSPESDTPTTRYTKSFELYYPGKSASSYADWKCMVEVPTMSYHQTFEPTRNIGIGDEGIRVDFGMTLPLYQNTEYVFTTTYRVNGELITNIDKSILSGRNEK